VGREEEQKEGKGGEFCPSQILKASAKHNAHNMLTTDNVVIHTQQICHYSWTHTISYTSNINTLSSIQTAVEITMCVCEQHK